jgi:hypothetical protein
MNPRRCKLKQEAKLPPLAISQEPEHEREDHERCVSSSSSTHKVRPRNCSHHHDRDAGQEPKVSLARWSGLNANLRDFGTLGSWIDETYNGPAAPGELRWPRRRWSRIPVRGAERCDLR